MRCITLLQRNQQRFLLTMRGMVVFLLGLCFALQGISQVFHKAYSSSHPDFDATQARCMAATPDGGYLIAGLTGYFSGFGLEIVADLIVLKVDSNAATQWVKVWKTEEYGEVRRMLPTKDGGYLLVGEMDYDGPSDRGWLVKLDATGSLVWERTWQSFERHTEFFEVIETTDGGLAITGFTTNNSTGVDMLLLKMDNAGTFQWAKSYGTIFSETAFFTMGIQETSTQGFMLLGKTKTDLLVIKTDSIGDTVWTRPLGDRTELDFPAALFLDPGDGATIFANSEDGSMDIYQIDPNGTLLRTQSFSEMFTALRRVIKLSDSTYFACGMARWDTFLNLGMFHAVKFNIKGQVEFVRLYGTPSFEDDAYDALPMDDGGFIMCGSRRKDLLYQDLYLVRIDALALSGCYQYVLSADTGEVTQTKLRFPVTVYDNPSPTWDSTSQPLPVLGWSDTDLCSMTSTPALPTTYNLVLFPNPYSHGHTLQLSGLPEGRQYSAIIRNSLGQEISNQALHITYENAEISASNLPPGLYLIEIQQAQKIISTHKLIIQP